MLRRHLEESDGWEAAARTYKQRLADRARDEVDRVIRDASERFETCKRQVTEAAEAHLAANRNEFTQRLQTAERRADEFSASDGLGLSRQDNPGA